MERIKQPAVPLTAFAQDFHEAGFGVIRHAIEPDAADQLRARLVPMLPGGSASEAISLQRVVPRIVERDRMFADLATSPPLVATMAAIFGGIIPQLVCSYGHEKPARTGAHTGQHSDVAHLPGVPHHLSLLMVKAMFALTPVALGSGETMLIPASHRQANGTDPAARPADHHVLLDPGDLLLFHANIRHSATDNTSEAPRLSLWMVYALPWMRVFPGYEYGPAFLADLQPRLAAEPHLAAIYGLDDPYATSST
jgi:hypothetical protein